MALAYFLTYLQCFVTGGIICFIGQILINKTKMTSARILVTFLLAGVFLEAVGAYKFIRDFGGAGATVPIVGFGSGLVRGVIQGVNESGLLGILTGGMTGVAAGLSAAILFGFVMAMLFKSHSKKA